VNDEDEDANISRRSILRNTCGAIFGLAGAVVMSPNEASATYTAYTQREEDWQQRQKTGDIKYSSSRELRRQLQELVPQNTEGTRIFCPNGASAAVSPLMENRCSDTLMAIPSVYGRTEDSMGNSIPGFRNGYFDSNGGTSSSVMNAMPTYGEVTPLGKGKVVGSKTFGKGQ
jgi:hypothetical protein